MLVSALLWGLVAGVIHFMLIGALYGNPFVDAIYQKAMKEEPGVKGWPSRPKYLLIQLAGTQVEVWILALEGAARHGLELVYPSVIDHY